MIALPCWKATVRAGNGGARCCCTWRDLEMLPTSRLAAAINPRYAVGVADKEATGFESPNYTGERAAPCGYFFVRFASVRLQWAAVVGSLRAAGRRVCRSLNPAICRPPRLRARRGVTHTHGGSHA